MERTVPTSISDEIRLYRSTIYSLLRSSADVKIETIAEVHAGMNSLMHPGARDAAPDISAFIYSYLRLPECFPMASTVILGQSSDVFRSNGFPDVESWSPVTARARRRRCLYNGSNLLACYIASRSDIEDIIPALTALQIEWNKMHFLLQGFNGLAGLSGSDPTSEQWNLLSRQLEVSPEDLNRLRTIWGKDFGQSIRNIHDSSLSITVRLLSSSLTHYMRATHQWVDNISRSVPSILSRPVYFVSSNTHSLVNLLTGFALQNQQVLTDFVKNSNDQDLMAELNAIESGEGRSSRSNFLYYVQKKFQNSGSGAGSFAEQLAVEGSCGITRVASEHTFDVDSQVISLNKLDVQTVDPRLQMDGLEKIAKSDALILNIDYPLGLAAYNVLSTLNIHTDIIGVYSMGKAASLNAVRGDVIIPNVVQDEISQNTYLFGNCFSAANVSPYLEYGTVLDNQKALTVHGTFLQNARVMDIFYREGFADIEMEAGNFLSALFEAIRPKRYPINEIVNLYNSPIDFGVLHYVSDTPVSKGKNLGAWNLSYYGIDSTYACSIAILRRIFSREIERLNG